MDRKPAGDKAGKYKTVKQKGLKKFSPFCTWFKPATLPFEFEHR